MPLSKSLEKLAKYYKRLDDGKARKIKPEHVEKVIAKLEARERDLIEEIEKTRKPAKIERLERKLASTLAHLDRARWLLKQIA